MKRVTDIGAFPGLNGVTFAASRLRLERDCDPTRFIVSRKLFNNRDYWKLLREAHRDIQPLIDSEAEAAFALPRGVEGWDRDEDATWNDDAIHDEYDRMLAKAEDNPLLARLRRSLSDGEINNQYI